MVANWRITTPSSVQTSDEFGVLLRNLFELKGHEIGEVDGIAISSVVPPLDSTLRQVCELYFKVKPLFVEPGVKTGIPILTDNPVELGAVTRHAVEGPVAAGRRVGRVLGLTARDARRQGREAARVVERRHGPEDSLVAGAVAREHLLRDEEA